MNKKLYKSEDNKVLCGVCGSGHYSEKTTGLRYAVFVRALIG